MMKDGVENRIETAVKAALMTVELLVAAGQPLKSASAASEKLTMQAVRASLAKELGNKSGSVITHTLATTPAVEQAVPSPAPAKRRTKAKQPQTVV
ncbi:hypothetical protein ACEN2T_17875 [Pseudomonas sp. W22_MBD1_FP4]|uniref:hypothetical protein n=1 Tax=Pseudomonas sp. W22_MBD1_FP4 TaxID=3240272 RepID=UPI003F957C4A